MEENKNKIFTEGISKSYSVAKNKVNALASANLQIKASEFVIIYGPSGSGKSTLLSLIAGLDRPTSGRILIDDVDLNELSDKELVKFRRQRIGMVFQQFNLIAAVNSLENVAMPLLLSGVKSRVARREAKKFLQLLGMADRAKHKPSQLSGGQQQRVAIARALIAKPEILLVDEPTGNLDYPTGKEILELLKDINQKYSTTVVLVTHNPDYVNFGCKVLYMEDGKITKEIKKSTCNSGQNPTPEDIGAKKNKHLSIFESMRLAKTHFFSKGFRAFLTTAGVAMGVGSVVALVSLGIGLQTITSNQLASFNALSTVNVSVAKDSNLKLDEKSAEQISGIRNVVSVSPRISQPATVALEGTSTQVVLQGMKADFVNYEGVLLQSGNSFNDNSGVIITKAVAKSFSSSDPSSLIGKNASLSIIVVPAGGNSMSDTKIIKIDEKITGISNDEASSEAFISISKLQSVSPSNYNGLKVKVNDRKNVEAVKNSIDSMGFLTNSVVELINKVDKVFLVTQLVLGLIGGIALIVALIGIINIMTVALLERTHEVGILKAIGATSLDIRRIFEYEVLLYGLFGSVCGVAGAWALGFAINSMIRALMKASDIQGSIQLFQTPINFAILMILLTILISLLGGWFPAKKASKLSASEALRYE